MLADRNNAVVRRYLDEMVSRGDVRAAETLVAPDVVFTCRPDSLARGACAAIETAGI